MNRVRSSVAPLVLGVGGLTSLDAGVMVAVAACAGAEVDVDVDMKNEKLIGPKRVLETTPRVDTGEAPRAAASFNHALQRTGMSRLRLLCLSKLTGGSSPSLSLGR